MTKRGRAKMALALIGMMAGPFAPPAAAQGGRTARRDPNPDAAIAIEQIRVGIRSAGASLGGGRLRFRGEEHSFSVQGLDVGSVGVTSLSASGEVFNLRRLEDFAGLYEEVGDAATSPPGRGESRMTRILRNAARVELRLRISHPAELRLSPEGVTIRLR